MANQTELAVAPDVRSDAGARQGQTIARLMRAGIAVVAMTPFTAYVALGLIIPAVAVGVGAFQNPANGSFTMSNIKTATTGIYRDGLRTDIQLSVASALAAGLIGFLVAYAIYTARRGAVLRRVVITASGVFANFGGVPLAFLFIATVGSSGIVTGWLQKYLNFNLYNHFTLFTPQGVFLVYMYFLIPLMVLIILPSLEGLRPAWREAAANLGARSWQYWRRIGLPVLMPSLMGCTLLLFGSSLSAYATAQAMTNGAIALTPIQIGTFLNGNVIAGQQNVGKALGLALVLIIIVAMVIYTLLQRRAARWLQ